MAKNAATPQDAPETKYVTTTRFACDGGVGGHPRVWLQIPGEHGFVECPYCDAKYVLEEGAASDH